MADRAHRKSAVVDKYSRSTVAEAMQQAAAHSKYLYRL